MKVPRPAPAASGSVPSPVPARPALPVEARWGLVAILGLAAALRFVGVKDADLCHYDEGRNYLEATATRALLDGRRGVAEFVGIRDPRPAHNILGALMLPWAPGPRAIIYVNAAYGVLNVLLAFAIARRLWGWREGLVAAGALALSPFHVYYSRHALVDPANTAVLGVALWALLRARDAAGPLAAAGWMGVLGLVIGWSLGHTVRVLPILGALGVSTLLIGRLTIPGVILLAVGAAAPLLAYDLVQRSWREWIGEYGRYAFPFGTYLEQFRFVLSIGQGMGVDPESFLAFPHFFWRLEGPVSSAWTLAAIGLAAASFRRAELPLHLCWIFPLAFFSLLGNPSHRFFLCLIPYLMIAKARVVGLAATRWPHRARAIWAAAGLLALGTAPDLWRLRSAFASPYAELLARTGDPKFAHVTTNLAMAQALVGFERVAVVPGSPQEAAALKARGFRYLIGDQQIRFGGESSTGERQKMWEELRPKLKVLDSVPYPDYMLELYMYNMAWTYAKHRDILAAYRADGSARAVLYDTQGVKW